MSLSLTSDTIVHRAGIPIRHSRGGKNLSPPLAWVRPPLEVCEAALLFEDQDAPLGSRIHWLIYGIPADLTGLVEGLPAEANLSGGMRQGLNDFEEVGYTGPMGKGNTTHYYRFTLFVLDSPLGLEGGATKTEFLRALNGTVIGRAHLTATFLERKVRPKAAKIR